MTTLALLVLWTAAVYLLGLGVIGVIRPRLLRAFLGGFARTAAVNLVEAVCRALVGVALIHVDSHFDWRGVGSAFGGFLLVTALAMVLLPGLHRRLAPALTSGIIGRERLLGAASIGLGGLFAYLLARG